MQKTIYEDYKYGMQDTTRVYVGCKYTFAELIKAEEVMFKFRMVVKRNIMSDETVSPEDTLETHLYYLQPDTFLVELYSLMKARIKISILVEKNTLFGKSSREYTTKTLTIEELVKMSPEQKEEQGVVIQELSVSKLALLGM